MWTAEATDPYSLDETHIAYRGHVLNSADVVKKLSEGNPGVHADWDGRHGLWHPDIGTIQGLFYLHKHLCSMDRGDMPQWPTWKTEAGLMEVPFDWAITHEDFPVLSPPAMNPHAPEEEWIALIEHQKIVEVDKIGWAEVFWHVLKAKIPGIDKEFLERTFRVPMDWYGQFSGPPVLNSWKQARDRGWT